MYVFREVFPQTWSEFIACIKSFTATCLSPSQRADFNRAVGDSINSVHKLCTNEDYKTSKGDTDYNVNLTIGWIIYLEPPP